MNRKLALIWATLQIGLGILLLSGTLWMSLTTLPAMRQESLAISENLTAIAVALDSATGSYGQSVEGVFALTNTLDDVGAKLNAVSTRVHGVGGAFRKQAGKMLDFALKCEKTTIDIPLTDNDPSFGWFGAPFRGMGEWCQNTGTNLSDIGTDIGSVASALTIQSEALNTYRQDGHEKVVEAMATSSQSLHHFSELLANNRNTDIWCWFLIALGLCVSALFLMNGVVVLLFRRCNLQQPLQPPAA